MAYLVFSTRQGEEIGRRPLEGPMVIGRSSECDVALTDGQLSRRHCRLMRTMEGWVLSDLDSRNGTKYRGERVSRHVLRDGQVFQIGMVNVLFRAAAMTDEKVDGLSRPKRPATPLDACGNSDTGFRYEPPPPSSRDVEHFPTPIPIEANLDWLDVSGELRSERM
jgi:pSer/pThr/pTyr-binding forkhead associated (FHA) protein